MKKQWAHSGNIILVIFACSAVAMCILVYACMRQKTDMVSEDYYEQELKFQENIDAQAQAKQYAGQFAIVADRDSLRLNIPITLSQSLASGTVDFYCASDSRQDKHIAIAQSGTGRYAISVAGWKKLPYEASIHLNSNANKYLSKINFIIPQ